MRHDIDGAIVVGTDIKLLNLVLQFYLSNLKYQMVEENS